MIIQNYNPASVKLFSKCARDHASRLNPRKRPSTANMQGQKRNSKTSSLYNENFHHKKKSTICSFDMSESRQQRAKKYRPEKTPAVGQYNPKLQSKPKLTWDILKIYNNKTKRKNKNIQNYQHIQINQYHDNQKLHVTENQKELNQHLISEISQDLLLHSHNVQQKLGKSLSNANNGRQSIKHQKKSEFPRQLKMYRSMRNPFAGNPSLRYKTMKSQVDMSRMTGRDQPKNHTVSDDFGDSIQNVDLNKSIQMIKSKTSQNVDFSKQLSRQKVNSKSKKLVVPSDYSYDINMVKPKFSAMVQYSRSKGRSNAQVQKTGSAYSYTHYEFDKYVWKGKSNIFNNTKTNVIDFNKERGRY